MMQFKIENDIIQETIKHYDSIMLVLDKEIDFIFENSMNSINDAISKNMYRHKNEVTIHELMVLHNKNIKWYEKNTQAYDHKDATIFNKLRNRNYANLMNDLKIATNIGLHESAYLNSEELLTFYNIRDLGL